MADMQCDLCSSEIRPCETCSGTGAATPGGDQPCEDCGSTGLQCPEHGGLWAALLPEKENSPVDDAEYEVDFGDPNPFVVPSGWLEQSSSINSRLGEQGTIEEESE